MNRAPIFIEVALWYHTTPGDHPSVLEHAPAYTETVREMVRLGLLTSSGKANTAFEATPAMPVYIDALCNVPTPIQRWVIPDEG